MTPSTLTPAIHWADPRRAQAFDQWLLAQAQSHQLIPGSVRMASADASFRRYFRIDSALGSRIIMDAPPDHENCTPFVQVAKLMHQAGLLVPEVLHWEQSLGFLLLSDLGSKTMLQALSSRAHFAPNLPRYQQALDALLAWQLASQPKVLPAYDHALLKRELALFPDWYLSRHRGVTLETESRAILDQVFELIIKRNLASPSVYVHRDFMPRNLMVSEDPEQTRLGVLDFQDAVYGPITYDIASLMRDAFLSWDEEHVLDVTIRYWSQARAAGLPVGDDFGEFYRDVEWMGLQRHLKVAGIFARLSLRDGKPQYLADTPRFISYIRATCTRYAELKPLLRLIERVEGSDVQTGYAFGRI